MTVDVATTAKRAKEAKRDALLRREHEAGAHRNLSLATCPLCCRLTTLQPYVCRCGTAGSRELVNGRAVGGAPRCNNCGRTMARVNAPYRAWVRV